MNREFAQLFRFALLVVGGFLAIGGAVMIFVWLEKDEDKKKEREQARARSGAREARKRGRLERMRIRQFQDP
jgi:heme O synthase-like polyprenyltransferase